jgi:hypothetical protein
VLFEFEGRAGHDPSNPANFKFSTLVPPQQHRQLCNVGSNTPGLVSGEPNCVAAVFVLEIDVREYLLIGVSDDKALVLLLDDPWGW